MKTALVVAALVATALAAPGARAGCTGVRHIPGWTIADAPGTTVVAAGQTLGRADETTHGFAVPHLLAAVGGVPGRWFASDGVSIFRSTDSGCTWQRVYTVEPTALAASSADALGIVATAVLSYRITDVAVPLVAPGARVASGKDVVYALVTLGLGPAYAPAFVVRSADGGRTWHTDLLEAPLAPGASATPVLGDGEWNARIFVSPADPRTAYVSLQSVADPRAVSTERTDITGIYVTRDAGATWAFAAAHAGWTAIVPDARDPLTFYRAPVDAALDAVTVGATPTQRRLLTLPQSERVLAIDTVREPGRAARLLVTSTWYDQKAAISVTRLHRSADGGRTWSVTDVPTFGMFGAFSASLTRTGDVETLRAVGVYPDAVVLAQRWTTRWLPLRRIWLPHAGKTGGVMMNGARAADTGHRTLAIVGSDQAKERLPRAVVGVADLGLL